MQRAKRAGKEIERQWHSALLAKHSRSNAATRRDSRFEFGMGKRGKEAAARLVALELVLHRNGHASDIQGLRLVGLADADHLVGARLGLGERGEERLHVILLTQVNRLHACGSFRNMACATDGPREVLRLVRLTPMRIGLTSAHGWT